MSEVIYLSKPASVHMADEWFEIATADHFWMKRRFEVLCRLGRKLDFPSRKVAEIGCGRGVLQQQLEQKFGVRLAGFDLNEPALRHSVASNHPRYYYNIFDQDPRFAAAFDTLILFDVLEHIEQEQPFLEAALFHLQPGGSLLVNVPALMSLYSRYDEVLGHQRRYTLETLDAACLKAGLKRTAATYWGLPFMPLLLARKFLLARQRDPQKIARRGYKPPARWANQWLGVLGKLDPLPQKITGTSLMVIYRKAS
jgi:SAM-dependent methyltransferase